MKLKLEEDGSYTVVYEWKIYRFLLDDGRTVDVRGILDDSTLREAVRTGTKAKAIAGVAYVSEQAAAEEEPKKAPIKRRARAQVTEDA